MGMRTLKVDAQCKPAQLHTQLDAAGFKVVTVRADRGAKGDAAALLAVIVFDESVDLAKSASEIQAVIDAHLNDSVVKDAVVRTPPMFDRESSLSKLEAL